MREQTACVAHIIQVRIHAIFRRICSRIIAMVHCGLGRGILKYMALADQGRAIEPEARGPMFGI